MFFVSTEVVCFVKEEMKNNRIRKRVYDLLTKASSSSQTPPTSGQPELQFTFFRKPEKFLESNDKSGHVGCVSFEKTTLKGINMLRLMCYWFDKYVKTFGC